MSPPSDRWMDVRRRIDDLEARLRRGRFTVPTYLAAAVFFLASGFSTGAWRPASALTVLCLAAAWISHRVRRTRLAQIRALHALETSLPDEEAEPAEPGEPAAPARPGREEEEDVDPPAPVREAPPDGENPDRTAPDPEAGPAGEESRPDG